MEAKHASAFYSSVSYQGSLSGNGLPHFPEGAWGSEDSYLFGEERSIRETCCERPLVANSAPRVSLARHCCWHVYMALLLQQQS